jgi:hypothetical protein
MNGCFSRVSFGFLSAFHRREAEINMEDARIAIRAGTGQKNKLIGYMCIYY